MERINLKKSREAIDKKIAKGKERRQAFEVDEARYTTIQHHARRKLGLSLNEYCVGDSVEKLSGSKSPRPGWCVLKREKFGATLDLSRATVFRAIDVLKKKSLVEVDAKTGDIRTTEKWYYAVVVKRGSVRE